MRFFRILLTIFTTMRQALVCLFMLKLIHSNYNTLITTRSLDSPSLLESRIISCFYSRSVHIQLNQSYIHYTLVDILHSATSTHLTYAHLMTLIDITSRYSRLRSIRKLFGVLQPNMTLNQSMKLRVNSLKIKLEFNSNY